MLGMELCGSYSTLPFSHAARSPYTPTAKEHQRGYVERAALTNPHEIVEHLETVLGNGSEAKALAAARHLVGNAHSPAESRYFIRLYTSAKRGGYGFPKPLLNARLPLPPDLQQLTGRTEYVIDFLHPKQHLGVEYDGGYHWNDEQRLADNLRELVLNELGIEVVRVDKHQLESLEAMDISAQAISKRLGIRLRRPSDSTLKKRKELQDQLLDFGFDLYI